MKTIALFGDSCGGQNKNRTILVMLHIFLKSSQNYIDNQCKNPFQAF